MTEQLQKIKIKINFKLIIVSGLKVIEYYV